ncbi:MAG: hypothetical protein K2Y37_23460 [Pirellulales bacterium]|nr:hypothetical protein [Pirellulales bacterium]
MSADDDWRLKIEPSDKPWIKGAVLRWRTYFAPSARWDHDHCVFCWDKFSETIPDALRAGYATEDDRPRHWICDECFEGFRERFGLVVVGDRDSN